MTVFSNSNSKGLLLATTTAVLWGFLAIALKIALKYIGPYSIVWARFTIAFVLMVGYYAVFKPKSLVILRKPPLLLILGAVLLGMNYIGFMQGIHYAGPGITQVFIQTGPIVLGVIGFIFFKERLTFLRAFGFFLAGIGFLFFYYQQLQSIFEDASVVNKGILWVLMAAAAWVGYAICNKLLVRTYAPLDLNILFYGIPAIGYSFMADFSDFGQALPWWVWLLVIFLGLNTVVAYGALSAALKYTDSNKISIIIAVNPVITFLILELLLRLEVNWFPIDPFSTLAYLGAFLVLVGAVLAIGVFKKR